MKLSIIIPVYNVEQYVGKCIESCLNQDLPKDEYEIIVVNDGSPDNSVQIVEQYIKPENNVRLVHRENGGLSAARNTGIREAKGDYIWFVDSDDWIEPNVTANLVRHAFEKELDVLCFNYQYVYLDGSIKCCAIPCEEEERVYDGFQFIQSVGVRPAAWVALYRRDHLQKWNLEFYEGILHEDQEFTPRAYALAKRIAFVDEIGYNYYQREGSIMRSCRNEKRCRDLLTVADSLYKFAQKYMKNDRDAYLCMINKVSFAFSQSLAFYNPFYFSLKEYKDKEYYPLKINTQISSKLCWKYRLINFSLVIYLKLYRCIQR